MASANAALVSMRAGKRERTAAATSMAPRGKGERRKREREKAGEERRRYESKNRRRLEEEDLGRPTSLAPFLSAHYTVGHLSIEALVDVFSM